MLFYSATHDVPVSTARTISACLEGSSQSVMIVVRGSGLLLVGCKQSCCLSWLYDATSIATIVCFYATGYRYIHEA